MGFALEKTDMRSYGWGYSTALAVVGLFCVLTGILVVAGPDFLFVLFRQPIPQARPVTVGCQSNLKNLGTALEMYESDFKTYPDQLPALTPNYLKTIPTCPAASTDTYSATAEIAPGHYTVMCAGRNHPGYRVLGLEENYPRYTDVGGLTVASEAHEQALRSAERRAKLKAMGLGLGAVLLGLALIGQPGAKRS